MPYIRKKTFKNKDGSIREYLFLVEGVRSGNKVQQKVIATIGRLDELQKNGGLERLKASFEKCVYGEISDKAAQKSLDLVSSQKFGALYFLEKLWQKMGYQQILNSSLGKKQQEALFCIVTNRLLEPQSKLGLEVWKKNIFRPEWDKLEVQHFYRAMDSLMEKQEEIEAQIGKVSLERSKAKTSLVMFDTTSIMHWGEGEYADILDYGYSKEKRGDLLQIMVGVLMTADGIPFAHKVWQGNQSDVKSFAIVIKELQSKYNLEEVIWVADRGMLSAKNIELLEELKVKYILGVRMRKLDHETKQKLLGAQTGFKRVSDKLRVKNIWLDTKRYIVCENLKEAAKEKQKREFFKEILAKKVEKDTVKSFLIKNGYKKYLDIKGELKIDWDRFEAEAIYDGKWVLATNTALTDQNIGKAYKDLWKIERAFRTLKTPLAVDPMFHWTTRRIKAHVFLCFMSLQIYLFLKNELITPELCSFYQAAVKNKLEAKKRTPSVDFALNELDTIHAVKQELGYKKIVVHLTRISETANAIFKTFKIAKPKFVRDLASE